MESKPKLTGYQKLAHLMTKHGEVAMFQRFDFLNTLNVLYLQAELVDLEQQMQAYLSNRFQSSGSTVGTSATTLDEGKAPISSAPNRNSDEAGITTVSDTPERVDDGSGVSARSITPPPNPVQDWWDLANAEEDSEAAEAWKTMLQARAKLKEYNEALFLQVRLRAAASPNESDLEFIRRWFGDKRMGDFPLLGQESELWRTSPTSELVALKPREGDDPLAAFFLKKVFIWWHHCIGRRLKKPTDIEANYFEYNDRRVLKVADCVGSIISSVLLVVSIVVLYFVTSMAARLGIVVAFTVVFSLALTLMTNARKAEVFAGTAAFAAVQVVFVGSTFNSTTP